MATEITPEIRRAIEASQGAPVEIVDLERQRSYVLLPAEQFAQLSARSKESDRFSLREMGRRAGWDDPSMDVYDEPSIDAPSSITSSPTAAAAERTA